MIEYARNVVGMKDANSTEFDKDTPHPVVIFMPEISTDQMGGNMRLGSRCTVLQKDSVVRSLYHDEVIIIIFFLEGGRRR